MVCCCGGGKMQERKYLGKNVYEAAVERIRFIFDEFEKIIVSFSGGKDSGVVLHLAIDEARRRKRKIGVMFIDLEAFYKKTIEFVERMFKNNEDVLEPFWVCLPMESPNSLSFLEPTWIWWDPDKEPIWVRPMPKNKWVINLENNPFDFYFRNMPFETFVQYFASWYGQGKKTASLIGIRTTESLNRYRAIMTDKETYKGKKYSTKIDDNTWNFYPIYDWTVPDIWTYYGKFKKDYNRLYDLFYKAGVSIYKMRVDEPFGNEAKAGLNLFRVIEPETWRKVVNRVSGANFGNIYHGSKMMSSRFKLPKNHTWKSFTRFLLRTLPQSTRKVYTEKFVKFVKYWWRVGCPMPDEHIEILEKKYSKFIINTHQFSKRGKGDKYVIKFKRIVDEIPELDTKDDVCTWHRLALTILKNDITCKSLSFGMTKAMKIRQQQLLEKYKKLKELPAKEG
jgi:predicted phosphoadenosine phosphosulfate sulfurtransferase